MNFGSFGNKVALLVLLALLLGAAPLCGTVTAAGSPDKTSAGAPDFELQDLDGTTVTLSKFKGQKPVLLYFWATWCPYCLSVRPAVINLRNSVSQNDLEILAINVGGGDSLARVKRFQEAHPSPLIVLFDGENKVTKSYAIQGIPLFVLVDKTGAVKYRGNDMPPEPMNLLKK
ncbi:MAG: peroxiredoxin family protein [Syntrophobacteraceae bacterium]